MKEKNRERQSSSTNGDRELIDQLDSKSRVSGDAAWGVLAVRPNGVSLVLDALRNHEISTRDGKVRALNLLYSEGLRLPEALEVYVSYLRDRSLVVAIQALSGVVRFRNRKYIPTVRELLSRVEGTKDEEYVRRGLVALEEGNPRLFQPRFLDQRNVWRLDEKMLPAELA